MDRSAGFAIGSVAVALLVAAPPDAAQTLLRFRPEPDRTLRYTVTNRSEIDLTMGAMGAQQMTNDVALDLHLDVIDVAGAGEVTLDFTYDRLRVEARSFGQTMVFDSAEPAAEAGASEFGDLLGKLTARTVRLQVDARGQVHRVEGLDAVFDGLDGDAATDPRTATVVEVIRGSFSDDAVRDMLQRGFAVLPEQAVGPGDGWAASIDVTNPMIGGMRVDYDYRYAGSEMRGGRELERLDFVVDITHDGSSPLLDQLSQMFRAQGSELEVTVDLTGATGDGTLWLEPGSGVPVELEAEQRVELVVGIQIDAGDQPQTMKLAVELDDKTSMKLTK